MDYGAECSVLAAILDERLAWHSTAHDRVADILAPEHFYGENHQMIYRAAHELAATGANVNWTAVTFWLKDRGQLERVGGEKYLGELLTSFTIEGQLETQAKRIRDLYRQRMYVQQCWKVIGGGYTVQPDVQEWMDEHQKALEDLSQAPDQSTMVSMGEALKDTFQQIQDMAARGQRISGLSSGYRQYDAKTGGYHNGELTLIAGRPGMGKSAYAMCSALRVARTMGDDGRMNGVAFFSVEMPRDQLVQRAICTEARVNINSLRTGKLNQQYDWPKLTAVAAWMGSIPFWIDDHSGLTPAELRAKCRRIKAREERRGIARLSLVVVDYLQRMKAGLSADRRRSRQEEVGYISWSLKTLAKELEVPVIALAQLNRVVEKAKDKRPQLSDLRESGDLEQDADNVVFIHREEYFLKDQTPADQQGVVELIIEKQRNGPQDVARTRFYRECALFEDDDTIGWE